MNRIRTCDIYECVNVCFWSLIDCFCFSPLKKNYEKRITPMGFTLAIWTMPALTKCVPKHWALVTIWNGKVWVLCFMTVWKLLKSHTTDFVCTPLCDSTGWPPKALNSFNRRMMPPNLFFCISILPFLIPPMPKKRCRASVSVVHRRGNWRVIQSRACPQGPTSCRVQKQHLAHFRKESVQRGSMIPWARCIKN